MGKNMQVWIVGSMSKRYKDGWAFMGVFTTKAAARCVARKGKQDKFVGPAVLDKALTEKEMDWPGAYWTRKEKKRVR